MSPEAVLTAALEYRIGSLSPGHRHRVVLEQFVDEGGGRWRPGPHTVGWVERTPGGVQVRLIPTRAGRVAMALLEDELLDVELSHSYPVVVQLVDLEASVNVGRSW